MTSLSRRRFFQAAGALAFAPTVARVARWLPPEEVVSAPGTSVGAPPPAVPPGTILQHVGECPPGFLPCDGRLVGVREYPTLYAAIGQTYGASPVRREFRVPDLNGRHTHGSDVSHQHSWAPENASHRHTWADLSHRHDVYSFAPTPRYVVKV